MAREPYKRVRHPWHPAIVHFPIACWALGTVIDLIVWTGTTRGLPGIESAALSHLLIWGGIVFAVPAVVAGLVDYLALPRIVQEGAAINRHMIWMGSAWGLFLVAGVARVQAGPFDATATWWVVLIELAGFACLILGGRAAATVVFDQMMGSRDG